MGQSGSETETEVKLWAEQLSGMEAVLKAHGAVMTHPRVFERNVRYDLPDQGLTARGVVLRLRQDARVRLTYKAPGEVSDGVVSRLEAEVEVADFEVMDRILRLLGYVHDMVYEKYRTTYVLDGCEIVLDELPFGSFVEIEGQKAEILAMLERLGWDGLGRVKMSYVRAFDVIRRRMGLAFGDATFAHFEGVTVPDEVKDWLLDDAAGELG
jgi:adenylate cyclase class 2